MVNREHGSPYDRGSADSYYMRPCNPHWYPEGTYVGEVVTKEHMSEEEIQEYLLGFEENEKLGFFKDYT